MKCLDHVLDQLTFFGQCVVNLEVGQVEYVELLTRLWTGDRYIFPSHIVGERVIDDESARELLVALFKAAHRARDLGWNFPMGINVRVRDIENDTNYYLLLDRVGSFENVVLEIVEGNRIENIQRDSFIQRIERLRQAGAKIAIDDFGSGYSNFARLAYLEPDYIKLDGELCTNIQNGKIGGLVKALTSYEGGGRVIVEKVEDREVCRLLWEYGVRIFQGYYFHKPSLLSDGPFASNIKLNCWDKP